MKDDERLSKTVLEKPLEWVLFRIPQLDPSWGRRRVSGSLDSVDFRDEGCSVLGEERLDARQGHDERSREIREGRLADDDQQCHAVPDDGRQLIGLVADAGVVSDRDPAVSTNCFEPLFIRGGGPEVIAVSFDPQPGCAQDLGKPFAEVAVGEEDMAQAARS